VGRVPVPRGRPGESPEVPGESPGVIAPAPGDGGPRHRRDPVPRELAAGRVIGGRYRLGGVAGQGAMGRVWRARDELLGRDVALKEIVFPPGLGEADEDELVQRQLREARGAARVSHPAVATVFDVVEDLGRPWIVMELVRGRSLDRVLAEQGPLPPDVVARLGQDLLAGLAAAHAVGVLHRDVKPSNVLLTSGGRAVLTDFGIAAIDGDPSLTRSGIVMGTVAYSSPERVRGEPATAACDLWSAGLTLYAAAEGQGPYDNYPSITAAVAAIATQDPAPPRNAGPNGRAIMALASRDPAARPSAQAAIGMLAADAAAGPSPAGAGETVTGAGGAVTGRELAPGPAAAGPASTAAGVGGPPSPAPVMPVRLAPRPAFLAGRDGLLGELAARLAGGPGPRVAVLSGLGGAGKTSVAVEYAHRQLPGAGVCWQFAAEDTAVLEAEFAVLAAQLGAGDSRDPVAFVHAVLARQQAGWLLVFDNVPDQGSVRRFLPPAGSGQVVITTQSQLWLPEQALDVPVLGPDVAAGFLVTRTGDPDRASATAIAGELGGLPLALEQAGAYMQAAGMTLAQYLPLLRARQGDLLARGQAGGHPGHVAATLGLALAWLAADAPHAAGLMRLLAFLAPEPVPLALLLTHPHPHPHPGPGPGAGAEAGAGLGADVLAEIGPLLGDPLAVADAVAALRRYSLVTPAGDGLVLVHRLVQAVTRAALPAGQADWWRQAAATLTEAAVPPDPEDHATWPEFAVLLPHARAVLDLTSAGMSRAAAYLGESGSHHAARELSALITSACAGDDRYGPEHPATLTARFMLARSAGLAGDPAGARDQLAALLPVQERILGPEHPGTLATRLYHAHWAGAAGDPAGARDQLAALLPVQERILGPEHPDTRNAGYYLTRWTGEAGDPAGARDQLTALLPGWERILGPEHPDILATRFMLARWAGAAGDPAGARNQFAVLLSAYERVLGPEHPHTLSSRHYLARWTGEAGDPAGARDQLAALLPARERIQGPKHPQTLATGYELARWTGEAGDPAGARDQLAALLPARERILGPEHPDTLATRHYLAHWTGQAGDPAGARDQLAALLPARERILGPEHPDTLTTRHDLAR
jgi:hypothetical protein